MSCYVTHLESAIDGTELPADVPQTLHKDRPLWVRYDLNAVREAVSPADLAERPATMWRYRELLPPADDSAIVSLGEQMTPILRCRRLGHRYGLDQLWIKDESRLPTGSFKSRGLAMAISMASQFGLKRVAIPTAGNAGGAMAAYAARAGHGSVRLHAGRYAGDQSTGVPAVRRKHVSGQRADHRLRPDRARRERTPRLVRHLDVEGAVSHRRQKDDGAGTGRAIRLEAAGRDRLSDRRRHRA